LKALLLTGCPELPVQTAAALYIAAGISTVLNISQFSFQAVKNRIALT